MREQEESDDELVRETKTTMNEREGRVDTVLVTELNKA